MADDLINHETAEWAQARKRVTERRDFGAHAVSYAVVNTALVVIWAVTGASYFWPAWILLGWGIGLVLHFYNVFLRRPVTDADIAAEVENARKRIR